MAAWKVAPSLIKLRSQIDAKYPARSKKSDGTIGDAAHASRDSDHNPWYRIGRQAYVTAMDLTHDPNTFDAHRFAEILRQNKSNRIKYVISNKRIFSGTGRGRQPWVWRPYHGSNPHDHHIHISVKASAVGVLSAVAWKIELPSRRRRVRTWTVKTWKLISKDRTNNTAQVKAVQKALHIHVDGVFGKYTDAAVRDFQGRNFYRKGLRKYKLAVDGVVGPRTAKALGLIK